MFEMIGARQGVRVRKQAKVASLVIGAVLAFASSGTFAMESVTGDACGRVGTGVSQFDRDFCLSLTSGSSYNPVSGSAGGGSEVPAKDPIKPYWPDNVPRPPTGPGGFAENGGSIYGGTATWPGPAKPKPLPKHCFSTMKKKCVPVDF